MIHILPAIDIRNGQCVRLQQGDFQRQTVYDAAPLDVARQWAAFDPPYIHIVDLDGAKAGYPQNLATVATICKAVSCRCELGGGIRSRADVQAALNAGVDRVVLGTVLAERPQWVRELVAEFSPQRLVAGLDARDGRIAVRGWQEDSAEELLPFARQLFGLGMRRFIYTDIATDGMFTGSNVQQLAALCDALADAQIIASGGIAAVADVEALVQLDKENLFGVIVGKALYDQRVTLDALIQAGKVAGDG